MRCLALILGCAALTALAAPPAHAVMLEVRYRAIAASVRVIDGEPQYLSPILIGAFTLRYEATGSAPQSSTTGDFTAVPGRVKLLGGQLTGINTGPLPATEWRLALGAAHGTLNPSGTLLLPALTAVLRGVPPTMPPWTSAFSFDWTAPLHLVSGSLDPILGPVEIARGPSSPPTIFGIVSSYEIDRHLVPEPGSFPTAAAGLAALAFFSARRRRRCR